MQLNTKPFGLINIEDRQKITFVKGIFGFESIKEYALLNANQWPFYWLQSIEVPDLAFILIDPKIFRPDYKADVNESDLSEIGIKKDETENILVFAIVTVPDDQKNMTANLQGPVIINRDSREGRQFITQNQEWKTKHFIIEELGAKGGNKC